MKERHMRVRAPGSWIAVVAVVWPSLAWSQAEAQKEQLRPVTTRPTTGTVRATTAPADVLKIAGGYEVVFDTSQVPELKEWVDKKLKPVCAEWYPKIVEMLPSDGYEAPKRFSITFDARDQGVASAGGTRIRCNGPWMLKQRDREALGAIVHEMVHVVQQYGGRRAGGNRNPGWLVEGLADYIRWHLYEPKEKRRRPDPARWKYDGSYHVTGAFLEYVLNKYDKDLIKKL